MKTTSRRYSCPNGECEVGDWTVHGNAPIDEADCFMCGERGTLRSFSGVEMMRSDDVEFPITPAPVIHSMLPHIDWTKIDTLEDLVKS